MKKLFILLVLALFALVVTAQDSKPVSPNFKQIPSPGWWWYETDTVPYLYRGNGNWVELMRANKKYSIWKHLGISNTGWTPSKVLGFDVSGNIIPVNPAAASMVWPATSGIVTFNGTTWGASITDNSANWNAAHSWGNWASNFGTIAGTIAQGNDSRILNGQTAYGWGNHASQGYVNSILINGTSGENANGFLDFIPGTNISITKSGGHVTISSTGGGTGTVTSVGLSAPTGFTVSGSPVTTSGTLALSFAAGYSLPSDATQANWTTAYNNRIATFTTTGNSGAATFSGNTLNIPTYTLAGLGGQPTVGANVSFGYNGNWVALDGSLVRYSNTILQRFADIGGGTYVGSTFPAASTTEAGLMSATDKTNLDAAVSNSGKAIVNGFSTPYYLSSDWFNVVGGYVVPNVSLSVANTPYLISDEAVYDALLLKANLSGAAFTGAISSTSTMTATDFILSSDRRLKENITPLTAPDWTRKINFVQYNFKNTDRTRYGVIAQDIEKFAPELVSTDEKGQKAVSYIDLLIAKIADLDMRIKKFESIFSGSISISVDPYGKLVDQDGNLLQIVKINSNEK